MKLGLTELLLLLAIAAVAVGPAVIGWVQRVRRRARRTVTAAQRRRDALLAQQRAEQEAVLRRFEYLGVGMLLAGVLCVGYTILLRPLTPAPAAFHSLPVAEASSPAAQPALQKRFPLPGLGEITCIRRQGEWLFFSACKDSVGRIVRIQEGGSSPDVLLTAEGEIGGFAFDSEGSIWYTATRDGAGSLCRAVHDSWGTVSETVVSQLDGAPLSTLTAVEIAPDGTVFFAEGAAEIPGRAGLETAIRTELLTHTASGRVFAYLPAARRVEQVLSGLSWAGGLALSPDGQTLALSDLGGRRILSLPAAARERTPASADCRTVAEGLEFYPAGLSCDPDGQLFAAALAPANSWLEEQAGQTFRRGVLLRLPEAVRRRVLPFAVGEASAVGFSPAGERLTILRDEGGLTDGGALAVWAGEEALCLGTTEEENALFWAHR